MKTGLEPPVEGQTIFAPANSNSRLIFFEQNHEGPPSLSQRRRRQLAGTSLVLLHQSHHNRLSPPDCHNTFRSAVFGK